MQESAKGPKIESLHTIIKRGADNLVETANVLEDLGLKELADITSTDAETLYDEAKKALKPPSGNGNED